MMKTIMNLLLSLVLLRTLFEIISVNKLAIPQPRTNYLCNSFRFSGAVLWNSLLETLTLSCPRVPIGTYRFYSV